MDTNDTKLTEALLYGELELQIEELEDLTLPSKIICVCSSTCSCTTSSCVGWAG